MTPGQAFKGALIAWLICGVIVLVLCLDGCQANRPADIAECYHRCEALVRGCESDAHRPGWSNEMAPASECICTCRFAMPFTDGGR